MDFNILNAVLSEHFEVKASLLMQFCNKKASTTTCCMLFKFIDTLKNISSFRAGQPIAFFTVHFVR